MGGEGCGRCALQQAQPIGIDGGGIIPIRRREIRKRGGAAGQGQRLRVALATVADGQQGRALPGVQRGVGRSIYAKACLVCQRPAVVSFELQAEIIGPGTEDGRTVRQGVALLQRGDGVIPVPLGQMKGSPGVGGQFGCGLRQAPPGLQLCWRAGDGQIAHRLRLRCLHPARQEPCQQRQRAEQGQDTFLPHKVSSFRPRRRCRLWHAWGRLGISIIPFLAAPWQEEARFFCLFLKSSALPRAFPYDRIEETGARGAAGLPHRSAQTHNGTPRRRIT